MTKTTLFKIISLTLVPLLAIELTLNLLFIFKDTLLPIIKKGVNTFTSPHLNQGMWQEFNQVNKFEHFSHILHRRKPFKGEFINITEDRNRVTINPSINDSSKLKKIWFFGGSTMWGTGSENDSLTIPSLSVKLLNQIDSTHDYFGVNFGESGFNSTMEFIQFIMALRIEKPDIVIFLDGVNDCMNAYINGFPDAEPNYHTNKYILENKKDPDYSISKIINILKRFKIIESFRSKKFYEKNTNLEESVAKVLTSNWKLINDLCLINDIEFYTFLQPNAFTGDYGKKYSYGNEKNNFYKETYNFIKIKNSNKTYFHDISNIMPLDYKYFYDNWCHTNSKGNKIIANKIVEKIIYKKL